MAVSKVVYGNNTLIDLTNDTVAAENLLEGYTAHGADGEPVVGTASGGASLDDMWYYPFKSYVTVGNYGGTLYQYFELNKSLCEVATGVNIKGCLYRQGGGSVSKDVTMHINVYCNDGTNNYVVQPDGDGYKLAAYTSGVYVDTYTFTTSGTTSTFARKLVDVELNLNDIREFIEGEGCVFGLLTTTVNQDFKNDGVLVQLIATRTASTTSAAAYFGFSVNQSRSSASSDTAAIIEANDPQVKVTF